MDTQVEVPEAPVTPPTDPEPKLYVPPPPSPAVVIIPRATFNYVVIAVVCLVLGVVIGMVVYDRVSEQNRTATDELINRAVATAVAALPTQAVAAAEDPDARVFVATDDRPSLGPADAPVVIVEFGDFHCGYCKRFNDETMTPLLDNYGDRVRFVFRDYPILGASSVQAALAANCAYDQNAFWDFHDMLYADPSELTRDKFLEYATTLNLDIDRFTTCFDEAEHQSTVVQDYTDAQALGVTGTPTFFINGKVFIGAQPYASFAAIIDAELALNETPAEQAS
ncbi:MAG: DsbA family protein [Anaerolineae bacterium]|nr:DsbA family protein [Anaerolineae bacterium]